MRTARLATIAIALLAATIPVERPCAEAPKAGQITNGDFLLSASGGLPDGWIFVTPIWLDARRETSKIPEGVTVATIQEAGKSFVRITYSLNQSGKLLQVLDVPPGAKEARMRLSVRGTSVAGGMPEAGFRFFSADGKFLPDPAQMHGVKEISKKSWEQVDFTCKVPPDASFCSIVFGAGRNGNGTFDFRGVDVRFR